MSTRKRRSKQDDESISYSKIHIPKMKSIFWKYFGFPADENNLIITKAKVVCTLCKSILVNHYNTTNIRSHIQANHKAIFSQLVATHGLRIPPRKPKLNQSLNKIPKSEFIQCSEESNSPPSHQRSMKQIKVDFNDSSFIEEESFNMPLTYEDTEDEPLSSITTNEVSNIPILDETSMIDCHKSLPVNSSNNKKVITPLNITLDINPIQVNYNIEEALTKMIITDLMNVSSIYNPGMKGFVTSFLSNQILPPLSKMENVIEDLYNKKFEQFKERIKLHSQVKPYSLSFDVWKNIEGRQLVSIHYNQISEDGENQFCDNLYLTTELHSFSTFDSIFQDFNLQNCSAAIINSNHEIINTFLSSSDIPIVHCFAYIINISIERVFEIEEVNLTLIDVLDVITRFSSEIRSESLEIPLINNEFALTKLHLLRFFCESVSWPEDMDVLLTKAKQIVEILSPLEITLDTLKEEDIPLSSLFLPFAEKIIEKHYAPTEFDDSLVHEMKQTVVDQFKRSVCLNNLLTVTAILDPRFHKFISTKNTNSCLTTLEKKYKQIGKQRSSLQKVEQSKDDTQKPSRKSHLKMFFVDCVEESPTKSVINDNFIEIDLRRYRDEAFASLEESPIKWWNQWGNSYGSLRHLSEAYYCILGFVNLSFKAPLKDQIETNRRRFSLSGKLINQVIFLNKNQ